jgi:hypothetical protein
MKLRTVTGLFIMVFLSAGCCFFLDPPPPPPPNDAEVVVESSRTVGIEDVWVHQEEESLVIQGMLHPGSFVQKKTGHVDIRIVDAGGQELRALKVAPDEAAFRKENGRVSPFSISIDQVVSPKTKVYLSHHAGTVESCARVK